MRFLFNNLFYEPLYNALVWLADILPGGDVGWAIILLTLVVKLILFPLQHRMSTTQRKLKELDPAIREIKDKYPKDQQAQAQALLALYREHGINPFSGFIVLLIQLPILFALFYVFRAGFDFQPELLYSFIALPEAINTNFLGVIDLTTRSVLLAVLAGATQYFQIRLAMPPLPPPKDGQTPNFKDDLARSMNMQMRFLFPGMIVASALFFPSAIALYWVTGNIFMIGHELVVKRKAKNLLANQAPTASGPSY